MKQKWYIIDEDDAPLYWCADGEGSASMMEFDTKQDALDFLAAADEIPFVDISMCYPISMEISLEGSRNFTGWIPVANGDTVELARRGVNA